MQVVETEELLKQINDPWIYDEVVHGTYREPMPLIMKGGLNKMGRNHIHMAIGMPQDSGVISGMRMSCQIVIEINIAKAMFGQEKLPFFVSNNNVILCEGLNDGSLPVQYFRSVLDFQKKSYVYEAPFEYICVSNFVFTCSEDRGASLKSREIIEFPIIIVDVQNKCIKSTFTTYVKPEIDPKLTDYCTEVTGITQEQVNGAVDLKTAMS